MRLQTKIAAAVLMGVFVAVGLSMIEDPPEQASAEIRRTALMAITGVEHLESVGLRVVDNISTGLHIGRWMRNLLFDKTATSGNGTAVEWERYRIARRAGSGVCIDRVTITNTEIGRHLHHSIRSAIVAAEAAR
jgi:hypothetical protein